MRAVINLIYRSDGKLERIPNGGGFDRLFQCAEGGTEYRLTAENAVSEKFSAEDEVIISLKRVSEERSAITLQRMTYVGERTWVYISNGWETDTNAESEGSYVEIAFKVRKNSPVSGRTYEITPDCAVSVPITANPPRNYTGVPEDGNIPVTTVAEDFESRLSALESELLGMNAVLGEIIGGAED
jgi:hypothetical protein